MTTVTYYRKSTSGRLSEIERCKGLGIMLVVYGHLVKAGTLNEQTWYAASKSAVYLFHMPLFFYLSGFVFIYTDAPRKALEAFRAYAAKRADRLLIPFVALALVIVNGKYVASHFVYVDQIATTYSDAYTNVFFDTEYSPVQSIWYLYVLFIHSMVTPFLLRLVGGRSLVLVVLGLVLYFVPMTTDFYLARVFGYFVFFAVGCAAAQYRDRWLLVIGQLLPVTLPLFLASLLLDRHWLPSMLISGLISIPAIHAFFRLPFFDNEQILYYLGSNSMVIYIFNTITIGAVKSIYVRFLPDVGLYFPFMIAIFFLAGLLLPVAIKAVVAAAPPSRWMLRYIT